MSGKVSGHYLHVSASPTISTSAYAVGDQLGSLQTLSVTGAKQSLATLLTLVVFDKASQNSAIDVLFFKESPTITSSDNSALDISDSEMDKCIGSVSVVGGDYVSLANNSVASIGVSSTGIAMKSNTDNSLFAIARSAGTPTYGSSSDLVFSYVFGLDF